MQHTVRRAPFPLLFEAELLAEAKEEPWPRVAGPAAKEPVLEAVAGAAEARAATARAASLRPSRSCTASTSSSDTAVTEDCAAAAAVGRRRRYQTEKKLRVFFQAKESGGEG